MQMADRSLAPLRLVRILHRGGGEAQRYRCLHLQEQLALLGIPSLVESSRAGQARPIPPCDLLVIHRVPLDGFLRHQLHRLRRCGTSVVFDTDDLVFDVREALSFSELIGDPWLRRALYAEDLKGMSRMLHAADGAIVATEALADRARERGRPAWVHRNAFSREMLSASEAAFRGQRRGGSVVVGYAAGTRTHERDFAVVEPVLREILEGHQNTEVRLIGKIAGSDGWGAASRRVSRVPFTNWQQLPAVLAELDVNLAPVELDRPFCEAKSEIKYVEAALVRVTTVATATGSYLHAIRNGVNGFVARTQDDWRESLERLVADPDLRARVGRDAYDDVIRRYHPAARAADLLRTLAEISARRAGGRPTVAGGTLTSQNRTELEAPVAELASSPIADGPERPHLHRALYSLRYDSPRLFALRMLSFLATRVRGRDRADAC
jgi:glycosyltransferase involved in cell wall biosynthesis